MDYERDDKPGCKSPKDIGGCDDRMKRDESQNDRYLDVKSHPAEQLPIDRPRASSDKTSRAGFHNGRLGAPHQKEHAGGQDQQEHQDRSPLRKRRHGGPPRRWSLLGNKLAPRRPARARDRVYVEIESRWVRQELGRNRIARGKAASAERSPTATDYYRSSRSDERVDHHRSVHCRRALVDM